MIEILQYIVQATARSGLYALVAVGFTLIFSVGGVLNIAHAGSIVLGAYGAYYVATVGFGAGGAIIASIVLPMTFGALVYLIFIKRVEDDPITVMIVTLIIALIIEQVVLKMYGSQPVAVPQLIPGNFLLLGVNVQNNLLAIFVLSWAVIISLFLFVGHTRQGKALVATSMSSKGAALVGIESWKINLITWVLAGALAGLSGMALATQIGATFEMGRSPLVLSFSIVIIGGIGSIKGSVIGAYFIGFLEVGVVQYVSNELTGIVPLVVLVIMLLVKPEGLYGRELVEK
jgi:branched-chain amino acid transport system permease protein